MPCRKIDCQNLRQLDNLMLVHTYNRIHIYRKRSALVKGIKVKDKEKIKEAIMISIQKGNYTTREIGLDIGKERLQHGFKVFVRDGR